MGQFSSCEEERHSAAHGAAPTLETAPAPSRPPRPAPALGSPDHACPLYGGPPCHGEDVPWQSRQAFSSPDGSSSSSQQKNATATSNPAPGPSRILVGSDSLVEDPPHRISPAAHAHRIRTPPEEVLSGPHPAPQEGAVQPDFLTMGSQRSRAEALFSPVYLRHDLKYLINVQTIVHCASKRQRWAE